MILFQRDLCCCCSWHKRVPRLYTLAVLTVAMCVCAVADIPSSAFRALEEKKVRALEENSANMWTNVELHFRTNKKASLLAACRVAPLTAEYSRAFAAT